MTDLTEQATAIVKRALPGATPATISAIVEKAGAQTFVDYAKYVPDFLPGLLDRTTAEIDAATKPAVNDDHVVVEWLRSKGIDLSKIPADRRMSVFGEAKRRMDAQPARQAPRVLNELSAKAFMTPEDRLRVANALLHDAAPSDPLKKLATANSAPVLGKIRAELARAEAKRSTAKTDAEQRLYSSVIRTAQHKLRLAGAAS